MATAELLMTLTDFAKLPRDGKVRELVEGRIVEMNPPKPRHGVICMRVGAILFNHVDQHRLGWVVGNDSGIVTRRNPDSLRGADVSFYSYARIPAGKFPTDYLSVVPELACEVMSEYDRWKDVMAKAVEYLEAGVTLVCVFHPDHETITILRGDREPEVLQADDELSLPEVFGEFRWPVHAFFV